MYSVKLSEAHKHPQVYKYLDDSIIDYIAISDDPKLAPAQHLIRRLKTRQLYPIFRIAKDETEFRTLNDEYRSPEYHGRSRKIVTASGTMPTTIMLHDDNGQIVNANGYVMECNFALTCNFL